ncbi:unnamed protein product [Chironomus riparius]|uniref:C2H2-type domain-containing protein n=1 Tax=Chironomus riparius TaxID=315576 RepID=A0A9N9RKI3_9DIPT|nr:unnamed protein product [Chironomus riparius]
MDNDQQTNDITENPIHTQSAEEFQSLEQVCLPEEQPGTSHQNNEDVDMLEIKHERDDNINSVIYEQSIPISSSVEIKMESKLESNNIKIEEPDQTDSSPDTSRTTSAFDEEDGTEKVFEEEVVEEQVVQEGVVQEELIECYVASEKLDKIVQERMLLQDEILFYCEYCSLDFAAQAYLTRHEHTKKHARAVIMARRGRWTKQKARYKRKNPVKIPQKFQKAKIISAIINKSKNKQSQKAAEKKPKTSTLEQKDHHVVPEMNNVTPTSTQFGSGLGTLYDDESVYHIQEIEEYSQAQNCISPSEEDSVVPSISHQQSQDLVPSTNRLQLQDIVPSTSRQQPQYLVPSTSRQQLQHLIPSTSRQQPQYLVPSTSRQQLQQLIPSTSRQQPQYLVRSPSTQQLQHLIPSTSYQLSQNLVPSTSYQQFRNLIPSTSRQQPQCLIPSTSRQQTQHFVPSNNREHLADIVSRTSRQQPRVYAQSLTPLYENYVQKLQMLSSVFSQLSTIQPQSLSIQSTSSQKTQKSAHNSLKQEKHNKPVKPYICKFCGREYARRDYFEKHVNSHLKTENS